MDADNQLINKGKVCPYCGNGTEYRDSEVVYGRSYGMIYICVPCDAYVGVHKGSNRSLGRLANKELREWKKLAHAAFDPLWKKKMSAGFSKHEARSKGYVWLSNQMELHIDETHIGMMDVDKCKMVIEICNNVRIKSRNNEQQEKTN